MKSETEKERKESVVVSILLIDEREAETENATETVKGIVTRTEIAVESGMIISDITYKLIIIVHPGPGEIVGTEIAETRTTEMIIAPPREGIRLYFKIDSTCNNNSVAIFVDVMKSNKMKIHSRNKFIISIINHC